MKSAPSINRPGTTSAIAQQKHTISAAITGMIETAKP